MTLAAMETGDAVRVEGDWSRYEWTTGDGRKHAEISVAADRIEYA